MLKGVLVGIYKDTFLNIIPLFLTEIKSVCRSVCVCVCVYMGVCYREREREREGGGL